MKKTIIIFAVGISIYLFRVGMAYQNQRAIHHLPQPTLQTISQVVEVKEHADEECDCIYCPRHNKFASWMKNTDAWRD